VEHICSDTFPKFVKVYCLRQWEEADAEEVRTENRRIVKLISSMCAIHTCQNNPICRKLVGEGKLMAWGCETKHSIDEQWIKSWVGCDDPEEQEEEQQTTDREISTAGPSQRFDGRMIIDID
jgi:hypothetical protein